MINNSNILISLIHHNICKFPSRTPESRGQRQALLPPFPKKRRGSEMPISKSCKLSLSLKESLLYPQKSNCYSCLTRHNPFSKENYRSVSALTSLSKVFKWQLSISYPLFWKVTFPGFYVLSASAFHLNMH